jgi:hypothetical protein
LKVAKALFGSAVVDFFTVHNPRKGDSFPSLLGGGGCGDGCAPCTDTCAPFFPMTRYRQITCTVSKWHL